MLLLKTYILIEKEDICFNTMYLEILPLEIIEEIAVNLDCKSLSLLSSASKTFTSLCKTRYVLKGIIQNKGYRGNIKKMDMKELKCLCRVLESRKFIPRQAYILSLDHISSKVLDDIVQVSSGRKHYLCLTSNGQVYGFGSNKKGQLGLPEFKKYPEPQLIPTLDNIRQVSSGEYHSLCLSFDGKVYGFGDNSYGKLDILSPRFKKVDTPQLIPTLDNIVQISAGERHSLGLRDDGRVYAFGNNYYGQLGLGDNTEHIEPELIPDLCSIVQVSAGGGHSLFLRDDGKVYSCGDNFHGQCGSKTATLKLVPKMKRIVQVSAGGGHSLCLRDDGRVYGFGSNALKQLALNSASEIFYTPKIIRGLMNIVQVSAGGGHSLFLTADGHIKIFARYRLYTININDIIGGYITYPDASSLNEVISTDQGFRVNSLLLI